MKLTNAIRSSFVTSVIRSIQVTDYQRQAEDLVKTSLYNSFPEKVRAMIDDPDQQRWIKKVHYRMPSGLQTVAYYGQDDSSYYASPLHDHDPELWDALIAISEKKRGEGVKIDDARRNLEAFVAQHTTVASLVRAFPDAEKYLKLPTSSTPDVSKVTESLKIVGINLSGDATKVS